jgi:hypothetical protein
MSKYKAKKTVIDGITFDSKREAKYYQELKLKEEAGLISELELQKEFVLIPVQREPSTFSKSGKEKQGKVIERKCSYFADFYYKDADGNYHCIDSKGFRTADYRIKRKLLLWVHGIKIEEV